MPDRAWTPSELDSLDLRKLVDLDAAGRPAVTYTKPGVPKKSIEAILEDADYGLVRHSGYKDDPLQYDQDTLDAKKLLRKKGRDRTVDVRAYDTPAGAGAPAYKDIFDWAKQHDAMALSDTLTPINERRRTANMIQQWLHDPLAGDYVALSPSQAPPGSTGVPRLSASQFGSMDPNEQLGWLTLAERRRFSQDLPEVYDFVVDTPYQRLLQDDALTRALQRAHKTGIRSPWGRSSILRSKVTNDLEAGVPVEGLPWDLLEGIGGYATGGGVRKR